MKRWFNWLIIRPWPIWILIGVGVFVGYCGDWQIAVGGPGFNKIVGAVLQAIGAILVLVSLDGNIGLFAGKGIVAAARAWVSDYPKKLSPHVLEGAASFQSSSSLSAALSIRTSTLIERVAELERIVVELRAISLARHDELTKAITAAKVEAREANGQISNSLQALEKKLEISAVGGLRTQFFGVGLALIGSVLSVFS